jgi:hypothetical protein
VAREYGILAVFGLDQPRRIRADHHGRWEQDDHTGEFREKQRTDTEGGRPNMKFEDYFPGKLRITHATALFT